MRKPKFRVVMDVSVDGEESWDGILRNIENLKKDLGPKDLELEVVLYGKAFPLAVRPEKGGARALHSRVEEAVRSGVRIVLCENTMRRKSLVGADLLPFIATVPSAMVELVKKQTEGWAYLKPGP